MEHYLGKYSDARGTEDLRIANDGSTLSCQLLGVRFSGEDFDRLEPAPGTGEHELSLFTLSGGSLTACALRFTMPLTLSTDGIQVTVPLEVDLSLGQRDGLCLALSLEGTRYEYPGRHGWFEDEMFNLQKQLPPGRSISSCLFCKFSGYPIGGNGMFGGLLCFRNLKSEIVAVRSKADYWPLLRRFERGIQETHLCGEFERREKRGFQGSPVHQSSQ